MTCPRCQIEYNSLHWGECPHCGTNGAAKQSAEQSFVRPDCVMKTSTILISGDDGGIFASIAEVPEPLRQTLVACTTGPNAATVIIADQGGRMRISAALRGAPFEALSDSSFQGPAGLPSIARLRSKVSFTLLAVMLVVILAVTLLWLVISNQ